MNPLVVRRNCKNSLLHLKPILRFSEGIAQYGMMNNTPYWFCILLYPARPIIMSKGTPLLTTFMNG